MKGVILAAGKTKTGGKYAFPENSKPKCLFHTAGETVLKKLVKSMRDGGLEDIRIVTGYRREDIERYNEEESLGLEIVYNPDWEKSGVSSLHTGLRGLDDDALVLYGDLFVKPAIIRDFLDREEPLLWLRMKKTYARRRMGRIVDLKDKDVKITKIAKEKFHLFLERTAEDGDRAIDRLTWPHLGGGQQMAALCFMIFLESEPKGEVVITTPLRDLDYYKQTDERLRELGRIK